MIRYRLQILLVLAALLFTANIGGLSIYILDEARNSACAREMLERNDFFVPTFNYQLRADKPPLHYFFMMGAYRVLGVSEFSARIFSSLCGICTLMVLCFFIKRYEGEKTAFWSGLIFISSLQVLIQFHQAVPDPYLILLFTASMFLFYAYFREGNSRFLYSAYILTGLGILTKGPVALILPGIIMLLFLAFQPDPWQKIRSFKPLAGLLITLAISAPWYIEAGIRTNGGFTQQFFFQHNIQRFLKPMERHGGSILLIPLYMIWGLFPFSLFIIQAVKRSLSETRDSLAFFSLCVVTVVLVFFSASGTKLPNYPAPAFAFLAVLLGGYAGSLSMLAYKYTRGVLAVMLVYLLLAISLPVILYLIIDDLLELHSLRSLAFWFVIIPAGALTGLLLAFRGRFLQAFYNFSASWIILSFLFFYFIFPRIDEYNPVVRGMKVIDPGHDIVYEGRYNPAFPFYLKKPVREITVSDTLSGNHQFFILSRKKHDEEPRIPRAVLLSKNRELFEPFTNYILYVP